MSYTKASGEHADVDAVTFFDLAAVAETTSSATYETDRASVSLDLVVESGTGTLDVKVQTRRDSDDAWRDTTATAGDAGFTQAAGATSERKSFGPLDREVKVVATIGTGPFTFSVIGEFR